MGVDWDNNQLFIYLFIYLSIYLSIYVFVESSMIFKDVKDDKPEVKLDDDGTPFFVGFGR